MVYLPKKIYFCAKILIKEMRNLHVLFLLFLSLSACNLQSNKDTEDKESVLTFDFTEYNYGEIAWGSDGYCEFQFENTGETAAIITDVHSSCGCTVPEWPKEPVKPGEKGRIKVIYNTRKTGHFSKTITLFSNIAEPVTLKITGTVNPMMN